MDDGGRKGPLLLKVDYAIPMKPDDWVHRALEHFKPSGCRFNGDR